MAEHPSVVYSKLAKRVEKLLDGVPSGDDLDDTIRTLVETAAEGLRGELGLPGGRFYKRDGADYRLQAVFG